MRLSVCARHGSECVLDMFVINCTFTMFSIQQTSRGRFRTTSRFTNRDDPPHRQCQYDIAGMYVPHPLAREWRGDKEKVPVPCPLHAVHRETELGVLAVFERVEEGAKQPPCCLSFCYPRKTGGGRKVHGWPLHHVQASS